jgi:uncharacterized protein YggE
MIPIRRFRPIPLLLALAITLAAPGAVRAADDAGAPPRRTISVSGSGEAQAAPDYATLSLAIETHAATAAEAAGRNGRLAQKVADALKARLGDKGKIWTGGYSLYPEYANETNPNARPAVVGYRAENSITVETGSLDLVGPLIDTAIGAGANRINSLDFNLRDETRARGEAIGRAARDAQAQAQALANALGVKLGPIVTATTQSQIGPRPVMMRAMAMSAGAETPIQPGQISVPATVSITYEIQ